MQARALLSTAMNKLLLGLFVAGFALALASDAMLFGIAVWKILLAAVGLVVFVRARA